jgi:glutathione synthase/RimK-type ligase-like ATP-grasp enzyme
MAKTITLLTDKRYLKNEPDNWYINNIFKDDELVTEALEKVGFTVERTHWDNENYDWSKTDFALFRTTWDYFNKFKEFRKWLEVVSEKTTLINPKSIIDWNFDKQYLKALEAKGVNIPETHIIKSGDTNALAFHFKSLGFTKAVLKPCIAGAARHTYVIDSSNVSNYESIFKELISKEHMMLQEFQTLIQEKGEVSIIMLGGNYSHAVLKKAKKGDFRVQDDFGGTVHNYSPSDDEIEFAKSVVSQVEPLPTYARVDYFWDNNMQLALGELELIEPELWFRNHPKSAQIFAETIANEYL